MTRWKRGGKPGGVGRGHLHNIPFIHGTKQTSTESLLRLEVGSTGKGRNRWGVGVSLKKIQAPPKLGCLGGTWSASTQEESEDQKQFGKARTVRGGRRRKVQGLRGLFGNWMKGLPPPPAALSLAGSGQPATPWAGLGLPDATGRRLEGVHKGLLSQEITALPASFSARVQWSLTFL